MSEIIVYTRNNCYEQYKLVSVQYDGSLRGYRPHSLREVLTFMTKADAEDWCRQHGWPLRSACKVASRFQSVWGISASHPYDLNQKVIGQLSTKTGMEVRR